MFRYDRERHARLLAEVDTTEESWAASAGAAELADPEVISQDPDDELVDESGDEEAEPPGPNVPNYPKAEIADAIENALDGFAASRLDDVAKTLRQVQNRLEVLTDDRRQLERALQSDDEGQVRTALEAIITWAEAQRALLET
jgi:hypothetical protein